MVVRNLTADTYKFRTDLQLGHDCSSEDNAATSLQKLEDRLVELETQMEAKEFVIQQQHRDLMRLEGLDP